MVFTGLSSWLRDVAMGFGVLGVAKMMAIRSIARVSTVEAKDPFTDHV